MGYFEWHEQPGYFRDVTRHFSAHSEILDIGCGTGWLATHLPRYRGIDASEEAVARARALGREVQLGSADDPLPFPEGSFDGVVLKDVLEHLLDPVAAVGEAFRVLRPGGVVFASSPDAQRWVWNDYTHRRPFTRSAFRRLFEDQGFEPVRTSYESVLPGTSIVSAWTRRKRRPRVLAMAAWVPWLRRNVWIVARRPGVTAPRAGGSPQS